MGINFGRSNGSAKGRYEVIKAPASRADSLYSLARYSGIVNRALRPFGGRPARRRERAA
jgi:hypothetical protein